MILNKEQKDKLRNKVKDYLYLKSRDYSNNKYIELDKVLNNRCYEHEQKLIDELTDDLVKIYENSI